MLGVRRLAAGLNARRLGAPVGRCAQDQMRRSSSEAVSEYPRLGGWATGVGGERDGMPRYPTAGSPAGLLRGADWVGTVFFAASGAITGATCGLDLFGATTIGCITAVGGGTLRDAVILHKQPFWIEEPEYLWMASAAACAAFFLWPQLPAGETASSWLKDEAGNEGPLMWWGDTMGVGAFAVIGAMNGCRMGVHPGLSVLCGVSSATFGGLTRDVICGLPGQGSLARGRILHSKKELYACTALVGAATYMAARSLQVGLALRIGVGVASAMGLRWTAREYSIGLPSWDQPDWRVQRQPTPTDSDAPQVVSLTPAQALVLGDLISATSKQIEANRRRN